jgi:hypothetical protein
MTEPTEVAAFDIALLRARIIGRPDVLAAVAVDRRAELAVVIRVVASLIRVHDELGSAAEEAFFELTRPAAEHCFEDAHHIRLATIAMIGRAIAPFAEATTAYDAKVVLPMLQRCAPDGCVVSTRKTSADDVKRSSASGIMTPDDTAHIYATYSAYLVHPAMTTAQFAEFATRVSSDDHKLTVRIRSAA